MLLRKYVKILRLFNDKISLFFAGTVISALVPLIQIRTSFYFRNFVNYLPNPTNFALIRCTLFLILLLSVLRVFFGFLSGLVLSIWKESAIASVQKRLFDHIQNLELSYHTQYSASYFISCVLYDPVVLQNHLTAIYTALFREAPAAIAIFTAMLVLNKKIALLSLFFVPFVFLVNLIMAPKFKRKSLEVQEDTTRIYDSLEETLNGIQTIKTLAGEFRSSEIFRKAIGKYVKSSVSFTTLGLVQTNLNLLIATTGVPIVLLFGISYCGTSVTAGDILAFSILLSSFTGPINALAGLFSDYKALYPPLNRMAEILSFRQESEGMVEIKTFAEAIEFREVSFSFGNEGDSFSLRNINLRVEPGEKIAIVGPSGAGKTTLIKLMLNLLTPSKGSIVLDSIPVSDFKREDLRRLVKYVPQEAFVFSATIHDNITFPKQEFNMALVVAAAERAGIYKKIVSLPEGFNAPCGRNGLMLSGGERQRLALARVFLNDDFKVLILDEAFRELDSLMEKQILDTVFKLYEDRTIIYVTHRLNSVVSFDRIIVLKGGEIICAGSHNDLMATCRLYREMFLKSTGGKDYAVDLIDSKYYRVNQ